MSWIAAAKKRDKMAAHQEAGDRSDTFLIRSGHDQNAIGTQEPMEFAKGRPRILEMFDDFGGDDDRKRIVWKRNRVVQVGL